MEKPKYSQSVCRLKGKDDLHLPSPAGVQGLVEEVFKVVFVEDAGECEGGIGTDGTFGVWGSVVDEVDGEAGSYFEGGTEGGGANEA